MRLRYAYFIKCTEVIKDEKTGEAVELRCTYDPATKGGNAPDGRRVKATLHWVSADHAIEAEARLYDHLFLDENPDAGDQAADWKDNLNPDSLVTIKPCYVEPSTAGLKPGDRVQFERLGYFCLDPDSTDTTPVFNRTATLRDTWAKIRKAKR